MSSDFFLGVVVTAAVVMLFLGCVSAVGLVDYWWRTRK